MTSHPKSPAAEDSTHAAALMIEGLSLSFGGLHAVQNFSLHLPKRAIYGLIGPNGAGKTTVFNLLTGIYRSDKGRMHTAEKSIAGLQPHAITRAGVARTFQNIRLFRESTVLDNVRLAGQLRSPSALPSIVLRTRGFRAREAAIRDRAIELLELFDMRQFMAARAGGLSYGHQRRLEIVRALATEPQVLLLDEPAAGMHPREKRDLAELIRRVRDRFQVAILLIDHDMGVVMEICERIAVLDHGVKIAEGAPREVQNDPQVIAAYLGAADGKLPDG